MRLSVKEDDPGYPAWQELQGAGQNARVFLNGIERDGVVTADEEGRLIVRHKTYESGQVAIDRERGEVICETLQGDVHIEVCAIGWKA